MVKITDSLQRLANILYGLIPQKTPNPDLLSKTKIVAHRGCWNKTDRLENTFPAFEEVLKHKIWGIEFDIRFTKDNVPVVHHDESTKRVFGTDNRISDLSLDQLKRMYPQIPTLEEMVVYFGNKVHLMIELKSTPTPIQVSALEELLKPLEPIKYYHFMSLNFEHFKPIHFVGKKCFVSIARTNIKSIFEDTLKHDIGGLTGQYLLVTNKMRKACHKQGIFVGTGFPTNKNLFFREAHRDVNWVFTNEAIKLSKLPGNLL